MATPTYANQVTLGQITLVLSGSPDPVSATSLLVAKAYIYNRVGNAAIGYGFNTTVQPITIAADTRFDLDISAFQGMRFDLNKVYIDGTAADVVDILYFA